LSIHLVSIHATTDGKEEALDLRSVRPSNDSRMRREANFHSTDRFFVITCKRTFMLYCVLHLRQRDSDHARLESIYVDMNDGIGAWSYEESRMAR